jgi:hypothetical protein
LHLARANEKRGELVEAFGAYERVQELALESASAPGMKDARLQAKAEAASLGSRIPWAEVRLASNAPLGALVFIDQQWLEPARLRSPYPVNPGWHTFMLESNGEVLAARRAYFEEGQSRLVPLTGFDAGALPAVASATPPYTTSRRGSAVASTSTSASASGTGAHGTVTGEVARAADVAEPRSLVWHASDSRPLDAKPTDSLLTSAYVTLGVGGLATLIGTGYAIAALRERSSVDESYPCFPGSCSSSSAAEESWRQKATIAGASYGIGIIGLATGGILLLVHHEYSAPKASIKVANIELEPKLEANGAALSGTF